MKVSVLQRVHFSDLVSVRLLITANIGHLYKQHRRAQMLQRVCVARVFEYYDTMYITTFTCLLTIFKGHPTKRSFHLLGPCAYY
jgi:hypothetical protein